MASGTRNIRRRIRSIRNTHQITRAMELVAAAKMRKAQLQALGTRTYATLAWELLQNVSDKTDERIHKLLRKKKLGGKAAMVLMTSNRGLIGGFNNALVAKALTVAAAFSDVVFICIGKKGREVARKRGFTIVADFAKRDAITDVLEIRPLAKLLIEDFMAGTYNVIALVYMDFMSTLKQQPRVLQLLPLASKPEVTLGVVAREKERGRRQSEENLAEYLFEPTPDRVLETLLPRLVEMQIYQALLETNASEHSARMVAMKNATDAASDLMEELVLEYNQLRQALITKEISEIAAGRLAVIT